VPFSDNSYKWAGGGFVSTVGDLLKFGNAMLYSYQWKPESSLPPGILKPETVSEMWCVVPKTKEKAHSIRYVSLTFSYLIITKI
jgi:serine beta-lactamase-like protein LACTB, mitochondrial